MTHREPKGIQIAGGIDPLAAAAIVAAISQQLADEEAAAAKPAKSVEPWAGDVAQRHSQPRAQLQWGVVGSTDRLES